MPTDQLSISHSHVDKEEEVVHMATDGSALPVVDLAPFFAAGDDDVARARATDAVREACRTYGFFRVVNHGVPRELVARSLELSAAFFALPDEEKAKVWPLPADGSSRAPAPLPVGYGRLPAHSPHKNEYLLTLQPHLGLNTSYPAEPHRFREALEECHARLADLGGLIQEILNECMGLPRGFLGEYSGSDDRCFHFLLALRYFPATEEEGSSGLSNHQDGNCVTFVMQDAVGGLEVLKDGGWVPAAPIDGSIIVNIGDVVQVLSNGKLKSATHRVMRKPETYRHSLAFFVNVDPGKWIEPLPEFTEKVGEAPRYRGFRYSEYQQLRLRNKTHPPSRPEDAYDITHYAI